ncbi:MAG: beta-glucosidase, partial [Burkholderiales bacterium PBB5]
MLQALAAQPALSRLSTRANDDPAMALIDAWACTLDVLTFYQERIANEGFLRTATERRSVLELARALGHELRPGVAAAADLAFTLETAPGAPLQARVAAGTKVQSVPAQGQLPQAFETGQALQARAAWNALRVQSTQSQLPLALRRNALYLKGAATRLQPGDAVLVVGDERLTQPGSEAWDLRRVRAVRVVPPAEPTADGSGSVTVVTLDSGLGSSVPVVMPAQRLARVFALRTQTRLFGCSAADWRAMPVSLRATYLGYDAAALSAAQSAEIAHTPQWPGFSLSELSNPPAPSVAVPGLRGHYFLGVNFEQPLFSRVDPQIDFASGVETKAWPAGVPDTLFSVRWTAWLQVDTPGDHHFQTGSDDGVRLWIDGRLLIDHWDNHGPAPDTSGAVNLVPGRRYSLRLEYFQGGGAATLRLAWALPGSTAFVTVPASRLEARLVNDVLLDASHPRVTVGSWLALATADYSELYRVSAVSETAVAEFALSARCTRVQLQGENLFERFDQRLRDTAVFAESEELGWAERPLATPVRGRRLRLTSLEPDLQPGRRLAISGLCPAPGTDPAVLARLAAGEELCLLAIAADGLSAKLRFLADSDDLSLPLVAAAEIHTLQAVDHSGEVSVLNLARPVAVPWLPASV